MPQSHSSPAPFHFIGKTPMNPSDLIPVAETIPVHWLWFKILLLLTFVLHILFMNLLLGGTILSFWGNLRRASGTDFSADLSARLPVLAAMTVNLGVAPLLFLQVIYGNFIYVSSVLGAVYWLGVVGLVILAYYGLYLYRYKYYVWPGSRALISGVAALCLLLVAFIIVNNMSLMIQPKQWLAYFKNPYGTIVNWGDPTLIPRYLHFVVASVAVAGLFVALVARIKSKGAPSPGEAGLGFGLRCFAWGSVVQVLVGLWLLISLPREVMLLFMGGSAYATGLFLLTLAAAATAIALGFKKLVWPSVGALAVTVCGMALMRDTVRDGYLQPYHSLGALKVAGQSGPLILFLTTFAVGLAAVGFMLRIYMTADNVS